MYEEEETHMNQILDMREKRVNLWNAAKHIPAIALIAQEPCHTAGVPADVAQF